MESIYVIISTAVAFIAIILLLATKSRVASKVTSGLIALAAISGLLIYGYGFSQTLDDFPLAVVRALLAVCGMFLGKNAGLREGRSWRRRDPSGLRKRQPAAVSDRKSFSVQHRQQVRSPQLLSAL